MEIRSLKRESKPASQGDGWVTKQIQKGADTSLRYQDGGTRKGKLTPHGGERTTKGRQEGHLLSLGETREGRANDPPKIEGNVTKKIVVISRN